MFEPFQVALLQRKQVGVLGPSDPHEFEPHRKELLILDFLRWNNNGSRQAVVGVSGQLRPRLRYPILEGKFKPANCRVGSLR